LVSQDLEIQLCELLGSSCRLCGISDKRVLQIDRKGGGITKLYEKFGNAYSYWRYCLYNPQLISDLQILCANCKRITDFKLNPVLIT